MKIKIRNIFICVCIFRKYFTHLIIFFLTCVCFSPMTIFIIKHDHLIITKIITKMTIKLFPQFESLHLIIRIVLKRLNQIEFMSNKQRLLKFYSCSKNVLLYYLAADNSSKLNSQHLMK